MRGERSVSGLLVRLAIDIVPRPDEDPHPEAARKAVLKDEVSGHIALPNEANQFCRSGGYGGEPPPDPIPNSVVKVPSADGTTS